MFEVKALRRGQSGYEEARKDAVWNGRTPERFPDAIVLAETDDDVIGAVRLAQREGLRIGVRSGGHSWAGNHVRDGGLLIDLSRLNSVSVDAKAMRAVVGAGTHGNEALEALAEDDLFFPAGHCGGVGLGGFLLQGGFGWNGRVRGLACMNVEAIDVVTADGELVRADAEHHPDLFWAARGAGPGFFGVVVRFHLILHRRPKYIANHVLVYPSDMIEDVISWAQEVGPRVPRSVELIAMIRRDENGEPEIAVSMPTLVDSPEEAAEALSFAATAPALERAKLVMPIAEVTIPELYELVDDNYPEGSRFTADNMWTHSPAADLLPGIRRIADTLPAAPSHMVWINWGGDANVPPRPDMAFSVEDTTYIAVYGVWNDPAEDDKHAAWVADRMTDMQEFATGIQLADENLGQRPARFVTDDNMRRLDEIRASYDPNGLFHPWMGRLEEQSGLDR